MVDCPACGDCRNHSSYLGTGCFQAYTFEYLACCGCGSLFVHPPPDETLLDMIYGPEYLTAHYSAELAGEAGRREFSLELGETVRLVADRFPGARLLDFGCGAGRFLVEAKAAGLCAEGYERLPSTAQAAREATGLPVHAGELSMLRGRYDVLHLADVLEHSSEPLQILAQVRRLLAPGGCIVARGPLENQMNLFQQALRVSRLARAMFHLSSPVEVTPYHLVLFSLAGWRGLMCRSGLQSLYERVYEVHWPAPETCTFSLVSMMKETSLTISRASFLRGLQLGNRVVSLLAVDGAHS